MELETLWQKIVQKWKTVKKQACLLWWAIHQPVALILVGFVREMQRPNRDWASDCVADKKKKIKYLLCSKRNREAEERADFPLSLCLPSLVSDCCQMEDTGSCRDLQVSQVMKASEKVSKANKRKSSLIYVQQWLLRQYTAACFRLALKELMEKVCDWFSGSRTACFFERSGNGDKVNWPQ